MGLVLIFICVIFITLLCYIRFCWKRARLYQLMKQFDGPPGVPILGNIFDFKNDSKEMFEYLLKNYAKKFKETFKLWLLHVPIVVVFKPEDIQILSSKNLEKDRIHDFLAELIGDGLATCSMEKWRRRRRIVNPAFQMSYLIRNVLGVFQQHYLELSKILENECDNGREFDLWPYIVTSTFGVICDASMGYWDRDDSTTLENFSQMFRKSCTLVAKRMHKPWLYPYFIYTIYKYSTGQNELIREAVSLPQKIFKERKLGLWQKKVNGEGNEIKDLVDMVGEACGNSQYLNDQEITDEILTIIMAGTETTAVISSFNFLMLAIKPEIQERVFNELDEIFGNSDRLPTADDLSKMIYLEQCLKETQRWASIFANLVRTSDEEIQLSDGRIIPVGAKISVLLYMTHHDETIYPEPYTWNPDNFLPEKIKDRHPYSYMPYGFGLRMCLGVKYATMSIKVLQSTILRKYKLRTSLKEENVKFNFDFMIQSANGYPVQLERRKPKCRETI